MSQQYHTQSVTNNRSAQPSGALPAASGHAPAPGPTSFQPSAAPTAMHLYAQNATDCSSSLSSLPSSSSSNQQQGIANAAPRTSSLPLTAHMGHSQSKPSLPPPASATSSAAAKGINAAVAGGIKLKRAFAGRKKKSEDASSLFAQGKAPDSKQGTDTSSSSHAPRPADLQPGWQPHRMETAPSSSTQVFNKKVVVPPTQSITSPPPPTPPKKEFPPSSILQAENRMGLEVLSAGSRNSIIPLSPGISSAVNYMMLEQQRSISKQEAEKENVKNGDKRDMKESWRKSDSTISHHTVRPGAAASPRASRPVSWAESFQSTHTVVQVSSKRLSALIGDADFGMPEEELEDDDNEVSLASHARSPSSAGTIRNKNRRSMSLNFGISSTSKLPVPAAPPSASAAELKYPSHSISEGIPPPNASHTPRARPISPSASQPQSSSTSNFRGRFAAWSAGSTNPAIISSPITTSGPRQDRTLPAMPPHQQHLTPGPSSSPTSSSPFRQTAISISASGIGPAAAGLAKRAVEMGRKWGMGMGMSSSSSGSGSSSSSSTNAPSSFSSASHPDYGVIRINSNNSTPSLQSHGFGHGFVHGNPAKGSASGHHKRTPNAVSASGAGSFTSSMTSGSESDPFLQSVGPVLGRQLRGGLRMKNGVQVTTGVVFGKDLSSVVRQTGIRVGKTPGVDGPKKEGLVGELEERMLPALVIRCAQHLLIWGVQEEGLFRVSGRPSHVSKLRSEFDAGVDYDMTDCTPGDLDPHAVASVFKAYLRELPEAILTQKLQPYFDAAINKETALNISPEPANPTRMSLRAVGPGALPSGPRGGFAIRKPPSLSTLAMPSFNGLPPPSKSLINAIRSLISQLPVENRDLIRTIVDLIRATAKESKETKMPLSNLMLVFCPSLNMTPPLLKVLCEADIWGGEEEEEPPVIDIGRHATLLDDSELPPPTPTKDIKVDNVKVGNEEANEEDLSDGRSGMDEEEEDSLRSGRASLDNPSSDYHASAEEDSSIYEERSGSRRRRAEIERPEVPTVYLDSRSHYSSSSASSLMQEPSTSKYDGQFRHHSRDAARDDGSISSGQYSMNNAPSPPPLSSSAESVATPTSSGNPSFSHLPFDGGEKDKDVDQHSQYQRHGAGAPQIAEPSPLELRPQASKRPVISNPVPVTGPVQFPSAPLSTSSKRRSIPMLSLPNFTPSVSHPVDQPPSSSESSPQSTGSSGERGLRSKKPSLRLLFSKRSASSLNSAGEKASAGMPFISPPMPQHPFQQPSPRHKHSPRSASDSSVSTPISAVTAPLWNLSCSSSTSHLPPMLDTPIEDPSLRLGLGFDFSPPATARLNEKLSQKDASTMKTASSWNESELPMQTPIASRYQVPPDSSSQYSLHMRTIQPASVALQSPIKTGEQHLRPQASSSNLSIISTTSSNHLSLFVDDGDEEEENWTQSVLSAAYTDGQWAAQKPAAGTSQPKA